MRAEINVVSRLLSRRAILFASFTRPQAVHEMASTWCQTKNTSNRRVASTKQDTNHSRPHMYGCSISADHDGCTGSCWMFLRPMQKPSCTQAKWGVTTCPTTHYNSGNSARICQLSAKRIDSQCASGRCTVPTHNHHTHGTHKERLSTKQR